MVLTVVLVCCSYYSMFKCLWSLPLHPEHNNMNNNTKCGFLYVLCTAMVTATTPLFIKQVTPVWQDQQTINHHYRKCLTNAVSLLQGHSTYMKSVKLSLCPSNLCNSYTHCCNNSWKRLFNSALHISMHSTRYGTKSITQCSSEGGKIPYTANQR